MPISNKKANRTKSESKRVSSIELLRILSMFSIVLCHFASHGGFAYDSQSISIPRLWWYFIELGGNFGVDVFVLISGYFLICDASGVFNFKRILKYWGQVFFYSFFIFIVLSVSGVSPFSIGALAKAVFPITLEGWWFASTYFVLYLLHPFLNMFLTKLDKRSFQNLLVLIIIIWCIIPTFTSLKFQSNKLLWFVTMYCVASYIRLYGLSGRILNEIYLYLWMIFSLFRYMSSVVIIIIGTKVPFIANYALAFYGIQSALTFLSALSIFIFFINIKMEFHKWINTIASASFGVYLIHCHYLVIPVLWVNLFRSTALQDSVLVIPYSIFAALLVYSVCTIIELIRKSTIERVYVKILDLYADGLLNIIKSIINSAQKRVFGKE